MSHAGKVALSDDAGRRVILSQTDDLLSHQKLAEAGRPHFRGSEGEQLVNTMVWGFWLLELCQDTLLLFHAAQCGVLCDSSPGKLITFCPPCRF